MRECKWNSDDHEPRGWRCTRPLHEDGPCALVRVLNEPVRPHFNKLTPEVQEVLAILAEECGEVVQRIGKILRHGLRPNPYSGVQNAQTLQAELTDVYTLTWMLHCLGIVDLNYITGQGLTEKLERLGRPGMMHHTTLISTTPCKRCGSRVNFQSWDGTCRDPNLCEGTDRNGNL